MCSKSSAGGVMTEELYIVEKVMNGKSALLSAAGTIIVGLS